MKAPVKSYSLLIMAIFLLAGTCSIGQTNALPVAKVDSSMHASAKPVLMLLTTDWCKYCQLQKKQLSKNREFQTKAASFYFVEFDAEQKELVTFHGHTYHYKATGVSTGQHELAAALSGEKGVSFPTWVLLDKDYQVLFRYNGVLSPQQLNDIMKLL